MIGRLCQDFNPGHLNHDQIGSSALGATGPDPPKHQLNSLSLKSGPIMKSVLNKKFTGPYTSSVFHDSGHKLERRAITHDV